jgi:hypothetical protein
MFAVIDRLREEQQHMFLEQFNQSVAHTQRHSQAYARRPIALD